MHFMHNVSVLKRLIENPPLRDAPQRAQRVLKKLSLNKESGEFDEFCSLLEEEGSYEVFERVDFDALF